MALPAIRTDSTVLLQQFIANQTGTGIMLTDNDHTYDTCTPVFIGLWRYYRLMYFPFSPAVLRFSEQEKKEAKEYATRFEAMYIFMKPIYAKITSGIKNEAVGLFATVGPEKNSACIIMREGLDHYQISGIDYDGESLGKHPFITCSGF